MTLDVPHWNTQHVTQRSKLHINTCTLLLSLVNQRWASLPSPPLRCGCEAAVSVQHLPGSTRAARQAEKKRPDRCRMAAGEEKDTADKRINYFINFVSQLTLHATFQVSQPREDEWCRAPVLVTPHQPEENSESEKTWGEERRRIGETIVPSILFKSKDKNDQITLSLASRKFPQILLMITKHNVQVN